jgi:hypothetical protein
MIAMQHGFWKQICDGTDNEVKADELEQYQSVSCWTQVLLFPGIIEFVCLKKKNWNSSYI